MAETGDGLWRNDFVEQYAVQPPRHLWSADERERAPRVLVSILAKQAEPFLPLYLDCLERQDYPKERICIYIRTNNNTDKTKEILLNWADRVRSDYDRIEIDATDVETEVEKFRLHEWNRDRFKVLGAIRNVSLSKTIEFGCDFYFVADVDNFLIPSTLRELVALRLPIAAPLLRFKTPDGMTSNFWAAFNEHGYYKGGPAYGPILSRAVLGIFEVPLVHCTYLIRSDVIEHLTYLKDGDDRHEFIVFSTSARDSGIPQYLDNRQLYGYSVITDPNKEDVGVVMGRFTSLMENTWGGRRHKLPSRHPRNAS